MSYDLLLNGQAARVEQECVQPNHDAKDQESVFRCRACDENDHFSSKICHLTRQQRRLLCTSLNLKDSTMLWGPLCLEEGPGDLFSSAFV